MALDGRPRGQAGERVLPLEATGVVVARDGREIVGHDPLARRFHLKHVTPSFVLSLRWRGRGLPVNRGAAARRQGAS